MLLYIHNYSKTSVFIWGIVPKKRELDFVNLKKALQGINSKKRNHIKVHSFVHLVRRLCLLFFICHMESLMIMRAGFAVARGDFIKKAGNNIPAFFIMKKK